MYTYLRDKSPYPELLVYPSPLPITHTSNNRISSTQIFFCTQIKLEFFKSCSDFRILGSIFEGFTFIIITQEVLVLLHSDTSHFKAVNFAVHNEWYHMFMPLMSRDIKD